MHNVGCPSLSHKLFLKFEGGAIAKCKAPPSLGPLQMRHDKGNSPTAFEVAYFFKVEGGKQDEVDVLVCVSLCVCVCVRVCVSVSVCPCVTECVTRSAAAKTTDQIFLKFYT